MSTEPPRLVVEDLTQQFRLGDRSLRVLDGLSFALEAGESLAVTGPSGSGKSTLLHLLGGLDRPTSGRVLVAGRELAAMGERELARFRNREVGFVFQDHHLLPQYTVLENVLLPTLAFPRDRPADAPARARELLARVDLAERSAHRPAELSGGERQRAAVARALIMRPSLLLGDEPTGSLDRATAATVADLLFELHRDLGTVLVVVTHSPEIASRFARRFELLEGRCVAA